MSSVAKNNVADRATAMATRSPRFLTAKTTVNRISFALKHSIHAEFQSSLTIEWE